MRTAQRVNAFVVALLLVSAQSGSAEIESFWAIPADGFARATWEGISRNVTPDARTFRVS